MSPGFVSPEGPPVDRVERELDPPDGLEELGVLAHGGFAVGAGTAVAMLLSVPAAALLVRSLGVTEYGALAFALGFVALATTLADLGLASAIARMVPFTAEAEEASWSTAGLKLATISGSAATLVTAGVALLLPEPTRTVLLAAAALPLVLTVRTVLTAHFRALRRIALVEISNTLGQSLYYVGAMMLAVLGVATGPRVAGLRLALSTLVLLLLLTSWRRMTAASTLSRGTWKPLLRFSLPLWIGGIAWLVLQMSDVIMLGFIKGADAVGTYAPVLQAVDFTTLVLFVLVAYYLPLASGIVARGDFASLRSLYTTVTKWSLVISAPLLSALIVAPGPLLSALFGSQYGNAETSHIAQVLALGYAATVVTGPNGLTLMALGQSRAIGVRSAICLAVNIALNALLIPLFGALGAAIGTAVVYLGLNAANSYLIWRSANLHPMRRDFLVVLMTVVTLTLASGGIIEIVGWGESLLAPALVAGSVALGSVLAWRITSSAHERRSFIAGLSGVLGRR